MDTFGRLPNDVIAKIEHIYEQVHILPVLDIVVENNSTFLVIKYPYTTQKINLLRFYEIWNGSVYCDSDGLYRLNDFIQDLKAGKTCFYTRNYSGAHKYISIHFEDNIVLYTSPFSYQDTPDLVLDKRCNGIFIDAMQKHYDLIKNNMQIK